MKIIVDPFLPFPIDSVLPLPCQHGPSLSGFYGENSVVARYLYLYYTTHYYLHHKLHCIDNITSLA